MKVDDRPLFDALAAQSMITIPSAEPRHLSGTVWAFATLAILHRLLLGAVP
eukprot:CAMPEP_0177286258 /NCGR_PEP_ID=MMETSP0367-20130122/73520_1 /TAXON_ID=447022 ORGANISM="Scrippsiella hangoei-like, Strain SHHI-4" /NCGR_SAMPLE_ID=MMETSP0367 /ASSEMBLY_ACC=CAM_ASM_000362 /LENGTH=50 /DNA_ID=CAMNT_0018743479 /DNA_START=17 /DNA_END=166 /DNA_ORIENTATION=+